MPKVLAEFQRFAATKAAFKKLFSELTPRERDILRLLAQGKSNREIAQPLYLTEKTVRNPVFVGNCKLTAEPKHPCGLQSMCCKSDGHAKTMFGGTVLVRWPLNLRFAPAETTLVLCAFLPRALGDGQYILLFIFASAAEAFAGLAPVVLTVILTKRKPQFARIALWSALGYDAFWAIVTTICEAIFIGREWVGGGVLATLFCMPLSLALSPLVILFLVFSLPSSLLSLLVAIAALLPLVIVLLVAFYFTPPRG